MTNKEVAAAFVKTVNNDHADIIPIRRNHACQLRDHILKLEKDLAVSSPTKGLSK